MKFNLSNFYFEKDSVYDLLKDLPKTIFDGGNQNRTLIMTELGKQLGISSFQIAPYARVIELVHNATLIHDDVIDLSATRRGSPTLNSQLENRKCILIGDYMLAKAMSELTVFATNFIVSELSRTLKDLVDGEILQSFENEKFKWSKDKYNVIADKKTGSVLRWCLLIPLMMKDVNDKNQIFLMEKVAYKLGLIYQMIDDVKDFSSLSKKTPFLDIKNWNINAVLINLQLKHPVIFEMLRLKREMEYLTRDQRYKISNSVQDVMFQVDQELDHIQKILKNQLKYTEFSSFLESFINLQIIQVQKRMLNYDFQINN